MERIIKTNFHSDDVPYNMYSNAIAVSKIDSVKKQSKNYHPQVYIEECKYTDAESQNFSMLKDSDDELIFCSAKEGMNRKGLL